MRAGRATLLLMGVLALLAGCGGGGSGGGGGSAAIGAATTTAIGTAPATGTCSLRDRQNWAAAQLREWYLFPETLTASLDPAPYATVDTYIDALTAIARTQRRDRYFTYLTSIAAENAYYDSGTSAGFGFRVVLSGSVLRVTEVFEGTAAAAAGIRRGGNIYSIGDTPTTMRRVSDILAAQGSAGIDAALGPSTAGTTRSLDYSSAGNILSSVVTLSKTSYSLPPVSSDYGARILTTNTGRNVGYVNLRTFISTADPALRAAFARFKAAGVTDYIVDLRYNGGGLLSVAQLLGSLLGADRAPSDVFAYTSFRPEKAGSNSTDYFQPQPQSVAPTRIAFIGTGGTASASELVINAFPPFLHTRVALIGANTYGKPVGQIALDRTACDDRLRLVAFRTSNAAGTTDYYNGLAGVLEATCAADDDLSHPLGDAEETSIRRALEFLGGGSCTPISTGLTAAAAGEPRAQLLTPARPTTAQREVPGSY